MVSSCFGASPGTATELTLAIDGSCRLGDEISTLDWSVLLELLHQLPHHLTTFSCLYTQIIDRVVALRTTRHKIGHFGDVLRSQSLGLVQKNCNKTAKANMQNIPQHKVNPKKLKPGLVASYDLQPGNGECLFWFWCFINLSHTYLLRHLPTYSPGSHTGQMPR